MVTRMCPHPVLDMADARHVEGVEPDGSACIHRQGQYATGDTEKRLASVTDSLKGAFGLAGADVGVGLRPKNIGARVKRVEDRRLLTGQGMFTADRIVPGALHVAFRRSDHAHALISTISTAAAAAMPGVFAIFTAQDLRDLVESVRASSRLKDYHATEL